MGLFSGKTTITVSSTLYNMAGPEEDRPNYLKGTLFSSVMANSPSLTDDITNSYFSGPGIKQRQFFNYSVRNDLEGLPVVTISNKVAVDASVVQGEITVPTTPSGLTAVVQNATIETGDPDPFLERWILENHPTRIHEVWVGDVDGQDFSIQFESGDYFTFTDTDYDLEARYVVAKYFLELPETTEALVEGSTVSVTSLPDLTEFTQESSTGTSTPTNMEREMVETRSYSDGRPDEEDPPVDADVTLNLNTSVDVHERTVIVDVQGYEVEKEFQRYTHTGTDTVTTGYYFEEVTDVTDIGGGVIRTTTQVTTGEQIAVSWDEKYDTQQIFENTLHEEEKRFIYKEGTGNSTLDALMSDVDASDFQEFFPFLPIRLNNTSIFDPPYDTNGLYDETKKAYRRATSQSFDKVVDVVEDNPDLADIDYAYVMYGCSLNVQDHSCRKYIYNFFEELIPFQNSNATAVTDFQADIAAYEAAIVALDEWEAEVAALSGENVSELPPRPTIPSITMPPISTITLRTDSTLMGSYDIRLNWFYIEETLHSGKFTYNPVVGSPRDALKGELELVDAGSFDWTERQGVVNRDDTTAFISRSNSLPILEIYWQTDTNNYKKLTIYGAIHQNFIYGGKAVQITSSEALADSDISGFVIPLHYPTLKEMSIVDYTQIATANTHILFNSYQVTKQKWYETLLFKIILIVVLIVVAVIISPAAFASGGGILGSHAAVGSFLGLTGTAALIAGVVANYLAAVVVSQMLNVLGAELFGEKWGALFAAIASFALTAGLSGSSLFSTENLLKLGDTLANGYAGFVAGDIQEMNDELIQDSKEYEKQMKYIDDLIAGLGGNDLNFDPLSLTNSVYGNGYSGSGGYLPETAEEFIRRTTMTGTDIVEMTRSMVYDFVAVKQTLPRN